MCLTCNKIFKLGFSAARLRKASGCWRVIEESHLDLNTEIENTYFACPNNEGNYPKFTSFMFALEKLASFKYELQKLVFFKQALEKFVRWQMDPDRLAPAILTSLKSKPDKE